MKELNLTNQTVLKSIWLAFGLAMATAAVYALIFFHVLPIGDYDWANAPAFIGYAAMGGYLLGGLLILVRQRWLWIIGLLINALVMFTFFSMHQAEPNVIPSAGGLVSKILQIVLELTLIHLIFAYKKKK
jgi:hypothetical protein